MAGEKRNQDQEQDTQRKETIVIVDIEGTTTSISFVKVTKSSMAVYAGCTASPASSPLHTFFGFFSTIITLIVHITY